MSQYKACNPSILIIDIVLPEIDGIELIDWLANGLNTPPVILISGYSGKYLNLAKHLATAKGIEVLGMLEKPFSIEKLEELLQKV